MSRYLDVSHDTKTVCSAPRHSGKPQEESPIRGRRIKDWC